MRTKVLLSLLVLTLSPAAATAQEGYRVIVHPDSEVSSVDRAFLKDVFLKRATRWPGDGVVRPVDHQPEAQVRRKFSQDVLGRSVNAVKNYWQQLIFAGRDIPPPELDTDAKIVDYVRTHPGAIGYVSAKADVSDVKLVTVK